MTKADLQSLAARVEAGPIPDEPETDWRNILRRRRAEEEGRKAGIRAAEVFRRALAAQQQDRSIEGENSNG